MLNNFSYDIKDIKFTLIIIVCYILFQYIGEMIENIQNFIGIKFVYSINQAMLKKMNAKLVKIKIEEYEKTEVYDLILRIKNKIEELPLSGAGSVLGLLFSFINVFTYIIMVGTIKWYYAVIILGLSIPYILVILKQGKREYDSETQNSKDKRKENYINKLLTSRDAAKEIRFYHLLNYLGDKAQMIRIKIYNITRNNMQIALRESLLSNFLRNTALIFCIVISCCEQIKLGVNRAGDILFIITAVQGITSGIVTIVSDIDILQKFSYFLNDWTIFEKLEDEICGEKVINDYTIKFEHVSFRYPNSEDMVLNDVNFVIPEGKKVAIVGENGSGKSTLISLVLGLYEPTSGSIYIGNKNLREVIGSFRNKAVCVFQNFVKYQMSLKDNLLAGNFGQVNLGYDNEYRQRNIFGEKMENLQNIILGQIDDNGKEISGGEWQKMAILRGLYRDDSRVLIMDEPTSNIDPEIESKLYEKFEKIHKDKTLLVVSHKISLAKLCDSVLVFDKGRIVESGTHESLINENGLYARMYKEQSFYYKFK